MVSSITPRFGARWPPDLATWAQIASRNSAANSGSRSEGTFLRSAGELIVERRFMGGARPNFQGFLKAVYAGPDGINLGKRPSSGTVLGAAPRRGPTAPGPLSLWLADADPPRETPPPREGRER